MSKMGNWVMEMQEDAAQMTLENFIQTHGKSQSDIWSEVNGELYNGTECENRHSRNDYPETGDTVPF